MERELERLRSRAEVMRFYYKPAPEGGLTNISMFLFSLYVLQSEILNEKKFRQIHDWESFYPALLRRFLQTLPAPQAVRSSAQALWERYKQYENFLVSA